MEKGFSKSAPKLWWFSGHVWKFQNHSGAVAKPKLSDREEFWDFLLRRLFVLMGNLLFQGGCGGNPNWCVKISTLRKITQGLEQDLQNSSSGWARHKLGWWSRQGKENPFLWLLRNKDEFWKDKSYVTHHLLSVSEVSSPLVFSYLSHLDVQKYLISMLGNPPGL